MSKPTLTVIVMSNDGTTFGSKRYDPSSAPQIDEACDFVREATTLALDAGIAGVVVSGTAVDPPVRYDAKRHSEAVRELYATLEVTRDELDERLAELNAGHPHHIAEHSFVRFPFHYACSCGLHWHGPSWDAVRDAYEAHLEAMDVQYGGRDADEAARSRAERDQRAHRIISRVAKPARAACVCGTVFRGRDLGEVARKWGRHDRRR